MFVSPTAKTLAAIASLCERSLDARRVARDFLDTSPVISNFEVDPVATARTGHDIFVDEPTQDLLGLLTTLRALDADAKAIGDSFGAGHGGIPSIVP